MRRTRWLSMSYTPSRMLSFSRRRTGPSSGSSHAQPLEVGSGSVAAQKMARATRSTGVIGMPATRVLSFQSRRLVSAQPKDKKNNDEIRAERRVSFASLPVNHGWMHAVRMLSLAVMGSRDRMSPNTACFDAVYCCAPTRPIQEAVQVVKSFCGKS